MATCNDKFQDQARWLSGVVLEFNVLAKSFLFRRGEILFLSEG
nr:hypothetical protein [Campylobacter concisus]